MKKRIVSILLVSLLSISLWACGTEKKSDKPKEEQKIEDTKSDDELSQSEWMEKYGDDLMEDGYEKVESINIDTSEISLKYTGFEIFDDTDDEGNPQKRLAIYCDFTNKTSNAMSSSIFQTQAFQNGIEMQGWGGPATYYNESLENEMVDIMDGATINIGFLFDLQDTENTVKFRVSQAIIYEGEELFAQQQEIALE